MSLTFYMDVHVPKPITDGLRHKNINVLTAQDDNAAEWSDSDLIDRATEFRRILVSQDADICRLYTTFTIQTPHWHEICARA